MAVGHGHLHMGQQEDSHVDRGHRNHYGVEVGSHQSDHDLLGEIGHSGHDHRRSSHVGVDFCPGNRHGEGYNHEHHGDHSHQMGKVDERGNGIELGPEECQVESK